MSMDEARDQWVDSNSRAGQQQLKLPLHEFLLSQVSTTEVHAHGVTRYNPEVAHERAGDPGYTYRIPESCFLCWAQEISEEEAFGTQGKESVDG